MQIAVAAAERAGAPAEYWFRFDCTNYPQQAPTARPGDAETNAGLAVAPWPAGRSLVPSVFRPDWQNGTALYLPCDRVRAAGHENWRTEHASYSWSPAEGIVLYLRKLLSC